jgi:ornithine cyclodeaminase
MAAVRPVRRVRVWSPSPERLRAFVERARAAGTPAEAAASAEAAVRGAHLICTVTASPTPVLHGDWVAPGAHINAVGASTPGTRELDSALVARARLFVDRRESAAAEAGDYLIPRAEGVIGDDHILGELGDLVTERLQGRGSHEDVTVFKSLGLAVEDVAAAHYVHERAARENVGSVVHLWTTSRIANA